MTTRLDQEIEQLDQIVETVLEACPATRSNDDRDSRGEEFRTLIDALCSDVGLGRDITP
jgi:hypothetical protein